MAIGNKVNRLVRGRGLEKSCTKKSGLDVHFKTDSKTQKSETQRNALSPIQNRVYLIVWCFVVDSTSFGAAAAGPKIGAGTMKLSRPVKSLTSDDPESRGQETR